MKAIKLPNSKTRLLNKIDKAIEKLNANMNYANQFNVANLENVREAIESLSATAAYKLERAISDAEYYDPDKDKFGFGPVKVNPSDYLAFCEKAGIEKPEVKDVDEPSNAWVD
jgi:hypothetical protein